MRWCPLPPVRRRRAGRRSKRRMAPCRNGIQTVAAWISKIPRNHEPTPGWAGTETGRPGRGRHMRLKARQHMHGMQCHVCRKRWGGSIRGYLIRRGANPYKGGTCAFRSKAHHRGCMIENEEPLYDYYDDNAETVVYMIFESGRFQKNCIYVMK